VRYAGADIARPSRGAERLLRESEVLLIAPSNPLASIGPILAVPGMREPVERFDGPRIAVSPLIGGRTVKGPADRMLRAVGFTPSVEGLATFYDGLIDGFVIDEVDSSSAPELEGRGLAVHALPSLMDTPARAEAVARGALELAKEVGRP
jgi:LPPG:FO 2-phospho-L-lactate transferase